MKERLRIRREKDGARRRTKGKKRSPDTDDYEKERLATLKRLKRGEVDLRLEKVVASKQLRLAVETEEERRTRLEAFLKSWQLCLSFKLDVLMRLSILCPTTPPTGLGGARWGFVILASTKAPPLGATLADKSPLIPSIGGGAAVGKWGMEKNMVQYETLQLRNSRSLHEMHHRSLIM